VICSEVPVSKVQTVLSSYLCTILLILFSPSLWLGGISCAIFFFNRTFNVLFNSLFIYFLQLFERKTQIPQVPQDFFFFFFFFFFSALEFFFFFFFFFFLFFVLFFVFFFFFFFFFLFFFFM